MRVITFYSYKGGVGRSLAAANFSVYLAKLGLKTVLIDFDLEAPGIDAKFPLLKVPSDQEGILDYILFYQQKNEDPGSIRKLCLKVPISNETTSAPLWLIPSGQYLSENYYRHLSQLDWSLIFSEKRDGIAFFQQFIARIKEEIEADFVIIDSRTGITEIAGLCTQQLADEVVMLSSLSSESIKVTKHIKQLIQQSRVAKALEKPIDVKVVVSRVPKPDDLESFKGKCCKQFEIESIKLFFLFSCSVLEQEEFLAITESKRDEELISNYVRLFYGLNIPLADQNIREEIRSISSDLLLISPEEAEKRILELVALYPHPQVYRTAVHFFTFARKEKEVVNFAWKLFELLPEDEEAQNILAKRYFTAASRQQSMTDSAKRNAIRVIEPLYKGGKLKPEEINLYVNILFEANEYSKSLEIALSFCKDSSLEIDIRKSFYMISIRAAFKLGREELANELTLSATEDIEKNKDIVASFEFMKELLHYSFSYPLLRKAYSMSDTLDGFDELHNALLSSPDVGAIVKKTEFWRRLEEEELGQLASQLTAMYFDDYEDIPF